MSKKISKKLSANDVGTTGGHQAGILVPKVKEIISFFPELNSSIKNPRTTILVRELREGSRWDFNFIYYNNKRFGGTRNEFRLTGMTKYLRAINAKKGDELMFSKDENDSIYIERVRKGQSLGGLNDQGILVLGGGWKIINK